MINKSRPFLTAGCTLLLLSCGGASSPSAPRSPPAPSLGDHVPQRVIIECASSCDDVATLVLANNGTVAQTFTHVTAIAVTVPTSALPVLRQSSAVAAIGKDSLVSIPEPRAIRGKSFSAAVSDAEVVSVRPRTASTAGSGVNPASYVQDSALIGATELHDRNITGADVIVAIIDSGTANNPEVVASLAGSVIGGENLVEVEGEPSATSTLNDPHGTWVGTMIAAHADAVLAADSKLAAAVTTHLPESIIPQPDGTFVLPLMGTAPDAKLYAIKVFPANGDGAPRSRTLAALDRVLTLKRNFDEGIPSEPIAGDGTEDDPFVFDSLNIQVVNLSLGGPTLFPSGDIEDRLINQLVRAGITVVASAGNEGFAAITGASPGAALASLTVGAASSAPHERILRDLQEEPGTGIAFRPTDFLQVAEFSSRGPTADGRSDPDVLTNGVAILAQAADGHLSIVSGTSFSAPAAAGGAALLQQAVPDASAAEIRAALIEGAIPDAIGGNPSPFDQGNGLLNVPSALTHLEADDLDVEIPTPSRTRTVVPVVDRLRLVGVTAIPFPLEEPFTAPVKLVTGEVIQFYVLVPRNGAALTVSLANLVTELPPDQQNVIFGDDLLLTVVDSPLSFNETRVFEIVNKDFQTAIENVQPGLMRVAVMGDWTNIGNVAATLTISGTTRTLPRPTTLGNIEDQEVDEFTFNVPAGTTELSFELSWRDDWSDFPTHDVDLLILDPAGTLIVDAATLANPERLTIADPLAGSWTALIDGFELHGFEDDYALSLSTNAGPLRVRRRD